MAEDCYGIEQQGIRFTLSREGHLHCAMQVETRSTPAQFLVLAAGLQSQLDEAPNDTEILVSLIIPCLYSRAQVEAMIMEVRAKVQEYHLLEIARAIQERQAGFEG